MYMQKICNNCVRITTSTYRPCYTNQYNHEANMDIPQNEYMLVWWLPEPVQSPSVPLAKALLPSTAVELQVEYIHVCIIYMYMYIE